MEFTAKQIADILSGEIEGNPDVSVNTIEKIEEGKPGSLTFLANPKYTQYIYTTKASIVIVNKDFEAKKEISGTLIRVDDAYVSFAKILEAYNDVKKNKSGISESSHISKSAKYGKNNYIGEFAFIGENTILGDNVKIYPLSYIGDNVKIGDNTSIFPGVVIYSDTIIGNDCAIHAGVSVGGDGFGFAPSGSGYDKIVQIGNVTIEDNVEIGANTVIDRATIGSTIIKKGVKLNNLVQIGHNAEIGDNTIIVSQTGISGSTKVGKNCMFGGQVGVIGHISIADNVKIAAQSGISRSIKEKGSTVMGSPAFDIFEYKKTLVHYRNLSNLNSKVRNMEKTIEDLKIKLEELTK